MTIAVTGSSGFVGSVLVPQLLAAGHRLKLLSRTKDQDVPVNVEFVYGDLLNKESLETLVNDADAVIHLAAVISIKDGNDRHAFDTNVLGTKYLLEAARSANVRKFIHLSSVLAFNQRPYNEQMDETREASDASLKNYDLSKAISQQTALDYNDENFKVIALAPSAIFGPGDNKPSLIGNAIINMYSRKIPALFTGGIDYVDVRDVVQAIINALMLGAEGKVYLLSGEWIGLKELAAKIGAITGRKILLPIVPLRLIFFSLPLIKLWSVITGQLDYFTKQSVYNLIYSNKKISHSLAEKELNFHPRSFDESLKDTIDWFKENDFIN